MAKLYMLPEAAGDSSQGRTAANDQTVRSVFVIGPDKKIKAMLVYPMSSGRNFEAVLRLVDSCQLTATHKVATPANRTQGEDVIIVPALAGGGRRVEALAKDRGGLIVADPAASSVLSRSSHATCGDRNAAR